MDTNVITPEALKPVPTAEIPTVPKPTTEAPALAQQNLAQPALQAVELSQKEQQAVAGQENLVSKMLSNIEGLSGESAYRSEVTQQSNIGKLRTELGDLNSQILQKQAEIQQDDIKLVAQMRAEERRDTLLPFAQNAQAKLAGDAQIMRALKTSEIGVLNALALGKQGNIELAKSTIDEAVNAKFAPFREQNAIYEAQLKAIEPLLTSAEKKMAKAQEIKVSTALREIDRLSEFQKTALNNAIANGAPSTVLDKISKAQSIDQITKLGSGYLVNPKDALELQKLRVDINKSSAEYAKTVQELNAARETIGGTTGDVTGDLIMGSSQYQGKQPASGWIDDFTQAQVALGNVKELQALVQKEGQTGPVSGAVKGFLGKLDSNFANAAAINAQIQRTVPGLARGIFKEVGVLTDQDIANYKKTLPNLASPEDQNKLALLATYDVIERSLALSLANQAKAKNDVSGYYNDYIEAKNNVAQLKKELGFVEAAPISKENNAKLEGMWGNVTNAVNSTGVLDSLLK